MRPSIVTTPGAGWEPRLASAARSSGRARLVGRCVDAASLASAAARADVVFVGSDVPWIAGFEVEQIRATAHVIGVASDGPGAQRLTLAGIEEIVPSTMPPDRLLALAALHAPRRGRVIEVTGPRGAPGRSEVALGLATALSASRSAALLELDVEAPSLGFRCGLEPGETALHPDHGPSLVPAPLLRDPRSPMASALIAALSSSHAVTVLDAGPGSDWYERMPVDRVVVVGEATPIGVIRLARLCADWTGPTPVLVVNRHRPGEAIDPVRAATGLEPDVVIPSLDHPSGKAALSAMVSRLQVLFDQPALQ